MFKLLNAINKENVVTIQGARHRDSNIPVATLLFQNYDNDTHSTYNMSAISCYDHYADELNNGSGDIVFRTKNMNSNELLERMRVLHNGNIDIGGDDSNALLSVKGSILASSNIQAQELVLGKLTATTSRIILKASNSNNDILNVHVDASNITGTLPLTVIPSSVSFSNITSSTINTTLVNTTRLVFNGSSSTSNANSNNSTTLTLGSNSDTLYFFKDWTNWTPAFSNNINVSNAQFSLSRYCVLNNNVTIDFHVSFNTLSSNINTVSFTLPLGNTNQSNYSPQIINNTINGTLALSRSCASSNNLTLIFQPLQIGSYDIAGQHSYVYV